ncbi:MAG: 6-carboxytetrahydropterin synthase [Gammaproteobacteria bacterium]|nr:6-carboxytetrahydropterin synthase [Gammaproteobacteria bacterium]MCP5135569.1 6-carboxytetrahydropterin synthase [Gammaproteobacteria bacterium]
MSLQYEHIVRLGFEAARQLPDRNHPDNGLRHAGHSFALTVITPMQREYGDGPRCAPSLIALREHVCDVLREIDYGLLNERLTEPNDVALLDWLRQRLRLDPDTVLLLCSAPRQGASTDEYLDLVWRRFRFEAAHRLPNVPEGHQCGRMHGHGFEVTVSCRLDAQDPGLLDAAICRAWTPLAAQLDHHCLNDIAGLHNPTSEVIAAWLWPQLHALLPGLHEVAVQETDTAGCRFDGNTFRIWKDQRFESAVVLAEAEPGDPRRQLHGHSYHLRLGLSAPLDQVYGWTVDFGDVKTLFNPIYKRLDHHTLNNLPGAESGDICALLAMIQAQAGHLLPQLESIELMETPEMGARVRW